MTVSILCKSAATLALAAFALVVPLPVAAAEQPKGPAVDVALRYVRAVASGDYASSYGLLTHDMQRYFGGVGNYASVWQADRFSGKNAQAIKVATKAGATLVTIREEIRFFDHGVQAERAGKITVPFVVVKENGAYRVDDEGHPYRSFVPSGAVVEHDGASVTVRKIAFYLRRIEVTLTLVNAGPGQITFLPYGRSVLRDESSVYRLWETRDWLLTDRQLFLGLRLAADARYTGQLNFQVDRRLDDRARSFTLTVAPALREGADTPLEFALPPIAVPAP